MNVPDPLAHQAAAGPRWRPAPLLRALGPAFGTLLAPSPLPAVHWVGRSDALAAELGLGSWLASDSALQLLAGNALPPQGDLLASVYSGHQFGQWAGQLGDGRALQLGEIDTPAGAMELQLKGAGLTPYSRMGDGRAVLRSSIREFLCSEAMHALGIPTTRALSVIGSPALVRRETVETAAVVARTAPSFIRFGHFEHFAHTAQDTVALQALVDAVIDSFYPDCRAAPDPLLALLTAVSQRTARLMADWQAVGFCHGVMNTDNMSILGLTIDYGPFGFLDAFDPMHICNHTDQQGRYAFARQPSVAFWNLHALAHGLLPLMPGDQDAAVQAMKDAMEPFKPEFASAMQVRMRAKLGLATAQDGDADLADDLLRLMAQDRVDHTIAWRALARFSMEDGADNAAVRDWFVDRAGFDAWAQRYHSRLQAEASVDAERRARMDRVNPKFVLRNHLAETAITAARGGDFSETQRLLQVLQAPYDEHPDAPAAYAALPPDWAHHLEVSCSS
ncbi:MAG: YdiU family protein [Aquabacterium sp.]|nr:YdiU family protein [Aquabacterium sp.]